MNSKYLHRYVSFLCILMQISQSYSLDDSETTTKSETRGPSDELSNLENSVYCKFQPNKYQCSRPARTVLRYYWDVHGQSCKHFYYGNCEESYNMFTSISNCKSDCQDAAPINSFTNMTTNIFCRFQPEFGSCDSYHPRFYFDINELKCKGFSFSGCGGNPNRFDSANDCITACADIIRHYQNLGRSSK